jgi:hypothetical protein
MGNCCPRANFSWSIMNEKTIVKQEPVISLEPSPEPPPPTPELKLASEPPTPKENKTDSDDFVHVE